MNIMKRIIRKLVRSKKAQSMVEMAIMLPVLLLLLIGIMDFGRILGGYMIIHELARDGVRAGVVGSTKSEIITQIKDNAVLLTVVDSDITVTPSSDGSRNVGDPLIVSIKHDFEILTPFIGGIIPDPWTLTAEYVMRIEQLP